MTGDNITVYIASVTPKGHPRDKSELTRKSTVDLPVNLWRAAKIRALDEGTDFRAVIIRALEMYLKTRTSRGS